MVPGLPYLNFSAWARARFGAPVVKIPVDAGFSCPNRDGTFARDGCSFCSNASFSPEVRRGSRPLAEQISTAIAAHGRGKPDARFWVYFQPYTNTHGPVDALRQAFDCALLPRVCAFSVGTRPDCVPDPVLFLLASYTGQREVWLELGLQSSNDATLERLRRRHTASDFSDAARRASAAGLNVLAHVILGLPGEGAGEARATAEFIAGLPVGAVKIHHFYVARGTALEAEYARGGLILSGPREHATLAADFLERIPRDVVVHRLVSDPDPGELVAPVWNLGKPALVRMVVDELARRGTKQGSLAGQKSGPGPLSPRLGKHS